MKRVIEEKDMRWHHYVMFRISSFLSLLRHAVMALKGLDAQICLSVKAEFPNGKRKAPSAINVQQHAGGDPRLLVIALRDAIERVSEDLIAVEGSPNEMLTNLVSMLEAATGKKAEIVERPDGTKQVKIRHMDGSDCDCENCRTTRLENGEATEKDRASLN